jgi:hypothetical protein
VNTQVTIIHQNLTRGLESHFKNESRRMLNRRAFESISPIISPELLTDAEAAWVKPAGETWVDCTSDNDQLNLVCLALFPVSLPKSSINGAMDAPLAPLLWFDIEAVDRANNRVKLNRASIRFNRSLLCDLSGLREDASHFETITQRFSQHGFNRKSLKWLATRLEEIAPSVDWRPLSAPLRSISWSSLVTQSETNQATTCYECAFLGVVKSSSSQAAILDEVSASIKDCNLHSPLGTFIKRGSNSVTSQSDAQVISPRLSPDQFRTVNEVQRQRLTVLDGQPGSGKSYTVVSAAINEVLHGRTVIISAPSTARLDRIADLIRKATSEAVPLIRSSGGGELRLLLNRIETLLNDDTPLENALEIKQTFDKAFKKTSHALELERASVTHPALKRNNAFGGLNRLVQKLVGTRPAAVPLDESQSLLGQLEHQAELALVRSLEASIYYRGQKACHTHRYSLYESLSNESSQRAHINGLEFSPSVWQAILQVMPIWIVDSRATHRLLPFLEGMFDLGVVDDSDEFDPSLALPLLFRCQRAMITGNFNREESIQPPTALEPTVQSEAFIYQSASLCKLVNRAMLDASESALVRLKGYYRVNGTLFRKGESLARGQFSSFTHGPPKTVNDSESTHWHRVKVDDDAPETTIQRTEARALIFWVKKHFESAAYQRLPLSIGIVSPFRAQVNRLKEMAQEILPIHVFPRHALQIGTPDRFEGNERDILLCSFGTHHEPTVKEVRRLDDHALLNVLFSRALIELHLFSSFDIAQFPPAHHLRQIFAKRTRCQLPETRYPALRDALESAGWLVHCQRRINALNIDFWITTEHINVGIMVVNEAQVSLDLAEQLAHARRIRTPIFVLDFAVYTATPSNMLNKFRAWLTRQGTDAVGISLAARSEAGQ